MESVSEDLIQDGVATDVTMNGEDAPVPSEDVTETDNAEDRPVRKAKRQLARQMSGGDSSSNNNAQANKKLLVFSKNSRKSRDGRGRGLPKKGLLDFPKALLLCFCVIKSLQHGACR